MRVSYEELYEMYKNRNNQIYEELIFAKAEDYYNIYDYCEENLAKYGEFRDWLFNYEEDDDL